MVTQILARYLSATILRHYVLFTAIALLVASLIEFLENRDGLMDRPALTPADILSFSVLSAPGIFSLLAGFIALVSVLVACITLLRHSELKAILAAGLSYGQLLGALLPAAIVMAGFHFCMENIALPRATAELRALDLGDRSGDTDAIWVRQGNYILAARGLNEHNRSLVDVDMFALSKSGGLIWHLAGPLARFTTDGLAFPDAIRTVSGTAKSYVEADIRFATPLNFDIVAALSLNPRHSSAWRIARVLQQTNAVSHPRYIYQLWLGRKLGAPITTALVVLLLAPLAQVIHRISSVQLLLMGLAAGFTGFVADAVLTGLAEAGAVSPATAAWALPVFLFIAILAPALTGVRTSR